MRKEIIKIYSIIGIILLIIISGIIVNDRALVVDFSVKNTEPNIDYIFGTDSHGRDIFLRTLSGLSKSLILGILASTLSGILALIVGIIAGTAPKFIDEAINFVIDAVMSIPHLVLLILISFCLGKGLFGVVMGIICTHWTGLARVIRGEVLQLKEQQYIKISQKLGKNECFIAKTHILPHILPQFVIGLILLFPHAILHESAITFLGFGLSPENPTIGIMMSESMNYVMTDMWWLFLPAISFVIVVILFDVLGKNLQKFYENKRG